MTVTSTKCPTLNKDFRGDCSHGSPDLEVLVKYSSDDESITGIVCEQYSQEHKVCKVKAFQLQKDKNWNERYKEQIGQGHQTARILDNNLKCPYLEGFKK